MHCMRIHQFPIFSLSKSTVTRSILAKKRYKEGNSPRCTKKDSNDSNLMINDTSEHLSISYLENDITERIEIKKHDITSHRFKEKIVRRIFN